MNTLPVLDEKVLQEKTNEYALKGANDVIKEFYTGYDSPYKKALREAMLNKELGLRFDLPDIVAKINDAITGEIDKLANEAIALTYIPMVKELITRAEPVIKFSDFLREIISDLFIKHPEDIELEMELNAKYGWYEITITTEERSWSLTLHKGFEDSKETEKYFQFLSLPDMQERQNRFMKLKVGDVSLEIPFTSNILNDKVARLVATYLIAKTKIVVDVTELEDEFFPERCHC